MGEGRKLLRKKSKMEEKTFGENKNSLVGSHGSMVISTPSTKQKLKDSHVTALMNFQFPSCSLYSQLLLLLVICSNTVTKSCLSSLSLLSILR